MVDLLDDITSVEYDKKGNVKKIVGEFKKGAVVTGNERVDNLQVIFKITPFDDRRKDKIFLDMLLGNKPI